PRSEQARGATRDGKTKIQRILPCGDIGVRAIPDDSFRLVLAESDCMAHQPGDRIQRAVITLFGRLDLSRGYVIAPVFTPGAIAASEESICPVRTLNTLPPFFLWPSIVCRMGGFSVE